MSLIEDTLTVMSGGFDETNSYLRIPLTENVIELIQKFHKSQRTFIGLNFKDAAFGIGEYLGTWGCGVR